MICLPHLSLPHWNFISATDEKAQQELMLLGDWVMMEK
jgi:hypothetical protein